MFSDFVKLKKTVHMCFVFFVLCQFNTWISFFCLDVTFMGCLKWSYAAQKISQQKQRVKAYLD